jgi:hypothetical protein
MGPQKIKNLTQEHEFLWNMIILKSGPPYYAFTPLAYFHLWMDNNTMEVFS